MDMTTIEDLLKRLATYPLALGTVTLSVAAVGYICVKGVYGNEKKPFEYPPGPPQDLLIGNLKQFPKGSISEGFCRWARQYGSIVYVTLPGKPIVILNSYEVAQELLSKRPGTTGNRRPSYMVKEIMGFRWGTTMMNPGTALSNRRKMLRRGIGPQRIGSHSHIIESITAKLMLRLHDLKGDPHPVVLSETGQMVLTVTYGTEMIKVMGNDITSWNVEGMAMINSSLFAFWPVDYFNFLRFIPSWFPGATFKRLGKQATRIFDQIRYEPFETVKELYNSGKLGHSLATDLLDEFGPHDDARDALAMLYLAGSDTTTAAAVTFLHTMLLFPDVADKVYREIKSVTHGQRLPQIADRPHLPFTEAVWKEAWRWGSFFPVGVPHVNTQDEILNGYLIPKGSSINLNYRYMLNDPEVWGDPEVFRPERFLERDDLPSPTAVVFGYGQRICPGMYLGDRGGFHVATTAAALYKIVPLDGAPIPDPDSIQYTSGVFRLPLGFKCQFIPRDEKVTNLLKTIALNE